MSGNASAGCVFCSGSARKVPAGEVNGGKAAPRPFIRIEICSAHIRAVDPGGPMGMVPEVGFNVGCPPAGTKREASAPYSKRAVQITEALLFPLADAEETKVKAQHFLDLERHDVELQLEEALMATQGPGRFDEVMAWLKDAKRVVEPVDPADILPPIVAPQSLVSPEGRATAHKKKRGCGRS